MTPTKQIAARTLKLLRFAGCQVPTRTAREIIAREIGHPISADDFFAALDTLGNKINRVRGQGGTIGA